MDSDSCRSKAVARAACSTSRWRQIRKRLLGLLIIGGLLALVYGPALDGPFVFDDTSTIVGNPSIRQLWPLVDGGPLDPPVGSPVYGRPLVNLSLALNYHFGELQPWGYRASHLVVHLASALLLWSIVTRTLKLSFFPTGLRRWAESLGFASALVWALHPLNSESVIYLTQRTELLMGFFYLATLFGCLCYWSAAGIPRRTGWLVMVGLMSTCGMLSKEMMASLPAMVLLYDRTFLSNTFARALRKSWPLYLTLILSWIPLLLLNVQGARTPASGFGLGVPAHTWWLTQAQALFLYLKLTVWPWPLVIHYELPYLSTLGEAWPWVLAAGLLIGATVVLVARRTATGYCLAWFFAVLSPTLLIPLVNEVVAERRMYVPLAALVPLLVVGGFAFAGFVAQRCSWPANRRGLLPLANLACLVALVAITASLVQLDRRRMTAYRSEFALWQDALLHQPDNYLVRTNLGIALDKAGRRDEALAELQAAVRLAPRSFLAQYNLARVLEASAQPNAAMQHYQAALRLRPEHAASHNNLGRLLAAEGNTSQAITHYEQAIETDPNLPEARTNLGIALAQNGYLHQATHQFEVALQIRPDLAAHTNLMTVYSQTGRIDEAMLLAREALVLAREQNQLELAARLEAGIAQAEAESDAP